MARVVLRQSSDYLITYHAAAAQRVVITFDSFGAGLSPTGFGSDYVVGKGWSNIHVSQGKNSQYQGLSLDEFESALSGVVDGYDDIVAYGSSLGGYAAFYYGGVVNARIIAFSPRNSAHPCIADPQFSRLKFRHFDISEVAHSQHKPLLILDPNVPKDVRFYTNCIEPAYPAARVVEVCFAGHRIAEALREAGVLSRFVYDYIAHGLVGEIKIKEEDGYVWNAEYAAHLLRCGRFEEAAERALRSMSIQPTIRAANLLGEISHSIGQRIPFSTPRMFRKGVFASKSYKGGLLNALVQLAVSFEQVGEYDVAVKLYEQASINFPNNKMIRDKLHSIRALTVTHTSVV